MKVDGEELVRRGEYAVIFNRHKGFRILTPHPSRKVPLQAGALILAALKIQRDKVFVRTLLNELKKRPTRRR
jgi:hypothetical protein